VWLALAGGFAGRRDTRNTVQPLLVSRLTQSGLLRWQLPPWRSIPPAVVRTRGYHAALLLLLLQLASSGGCFLCVWRLWNSAAARVGCRALARQRSAQFIPQSLFSACLVLQLPAQLAGLQAKTKPTSPLAPTSLR
jgi:hypothetical protein